MKRAIVLPLLIAFLFANTELHQLLKLPVLMHHFIEHRHQNQQESLFLFLIEHYNDNSSHCNDNQNDHKNLPFKTHDCATMHSTVVFNTISSFVIEEPISISLKVSALKDKLFVPSTFLFNIWQPPKIN